MSANTKIEWADHTFNPWEGCQKVGPGCDHCYAETRNARFGGGQAVNWGPGAPRRRTSAKNWQLPVKWNAEAAAKGIRYRVFCASLADVFDNEVDREWRDDLATLILNTPNLDWLLLTKRIGNAGTMLGQMFLDGPPDNVWIGATIVNQDEAHRDIPKLLRIPARVRFLSMEPLLGAVDILPMFEHRATVHNDTGIDWVIVGGESGPGARPMHISWARSIVKQCKDAGVAVHVKQLGAQPRGWCAAQVHSDDPDREDDACDFYEAHEFREPCPGRCAAMVDKKGGDMDEWPEDLRVREFPQ